MLVKEVVEEIFQDYKMKLVPFFLIKWRPNINLPSERTHPSSEAKRLIDVE